MGDLDLIQAFDVYLLFFLVAYIALRAKNLLCVAAIVLRGRSRWPRLCALVRQNRSLLITRSVLMPAAVVITCAAIQWLCSSVIWPDARVPLAGLRGDSVLPWLLAIIAITTVAFDVLDLIRTQPLERVALEQQLDRAEYWLSSMSSTVVRIFSLGLFDPRRRVAKEVKRALVGLQAALSVQLWSMVLQSVFYLAFGICLWLNWARMAP